jgi:hypothetical protein
MARSVYFPWSRARRGRADRRSHRAPGTRPDRRRVARTMVTGSYATPPNGSGRLTPPHFGSRFGISARPPVPCRCSAALVVQQGTTSSARCSKRRSACSIQTGSGRCLRRNTAFRVRRLNGLISPGATSAGRTSQIVEGTFAFGSDCVLGDPRSLTHGPGGLHSPKIRASGRRFAHKRAVACL